MGVAWMRWLLAICFLVASVVVAEAQQACGPKEQVENVLLGRHQEVQVWHGFSTKYGDIYKLYLQAGGGSWSIVQISPAGWACIVAAGVQWWSVLKPEIGEPL